MRCNERTMAFHEEVLRRVADGNWDQEVVNEMLYEERYDLKWDLFPARDMDFALLLSRSDEHRASSSGRVGSVREGEEHDGSRKGGPSRR